MTRLDEIAARLQALIEAVADGEYIHSEADDGLVYRVHLSAADAERLLDEPVTTAPADLAYLLGHARQAEAALAAAQAEAARLRAALVAIEKQLPRHSAHVQAAIGAYIDSALAAPAPNAERVRALLFVAEASQRLNRAHEITNEAVKDWTSPAYRNAVDEANEAYKEWRKALAALDD